MASSVVCLSRTDGALGEQIAHAVARQLEYRYVDEEIVQRAAEKANVDPETIMDAERRKSFVRRLLEGLPSPAVIADPFRVITGLPLGLEEITLLAPRPMKADARDVIRAVIGECAHEGRVVIVAHAASMALKGMAGVLRVLITASAAVRAGRVSHGGKLLEPAAAAAAIRESDRNRQDYLRRFYDVEREEPTHYDLVINTDLLTPQQAAAIVCDAARTIAV